MGGGVSVPRDGLKKDWEKDLMNKEGLERRFVHTGKLNHNKKRTDRKTSVAPSKQKEEKRSIFEFV